jgi:hypothetical protein
MKSGEIGGISAAAVVVVVSLIGGVLYYSSFKKDENKQELAGNSNIQPKPNTGYNYGRVSDVSDDPDPYNKNNYRTSDVDRTSFTTGGKQTKRKRQRKRRSRRQRK